MKPTIALLTAQDNEGDQLIAVSPEALQTQGDVCGIPLYPRWGWKFVLDVDRAIWGKALAHLRNKGWRFEYADAWDIENMDYDANTVQYLTFKTAAALLEYVEDQQPE